MPASCAFCGSTSSLTREHVFGEWVSTIGLDLTPSQHRAGPLNGLPRDMGIQPPYRQKVKNVCASCNNGWMSHLEKVAARVLSPLILGDSGIVPAEDRALITLWAQKTALVAMLLSSDDQRGEGYGLSPTVYSSLFEKQAQKQPLDASQFWIGRYEGPKGFAAIRVTPMVVRLPGIPEPWVPQGYAMTIVLGELIVHGVVFTMSEFQMEVSFGLDMPKLWPGEGLLRWPEGRVCTATSFLGVADGRALHPAVEHVGLEPWSVATQVAQSEIVDGRVQVPALCGLHVFYYPLPLLRQASKGRFYAFVASCPCPVTYLVHLESDGAHCKGAGPFAEINDRYAAIPGDEILIRDPVDFSCKRLTPDASNPV